MPDLPKDYFKTWGHGDLVCLDMDSTVCVDESINEYSKMLGKFHEIQALTNSAMNGDMKFEDSFKKRLETMAPTKEDFEQFLKNREKLTYQNKLITNGVSHFVATLRRQGVHVCLLTGGFYEIAEMVAKFIGMEARPGFETLKSGKTDVMLCGGVSLPPTIYANQLIFDETGKYNGLIDSPVSRAGGKPDVIKSLVEKFDFKNIVMIGDGATDLEAKSELVTFIAFTEHVKREAVVEEADFEMASFCSQEN